MTFWNILKNTFLLLVLLNIAPLLVDNIKTQYRSWFVPTTQVGILTIKGQIVESTPYNKALTSFFTDDAIKAIVLKIESPGGACGSCQALFNEIVHLKKDHPKPIIALIENNCTGGGYYIASATDHIVAAGTSIIGGIGLHISDQVHDAIENDKNSGQPKNNTTVSAKLALNAYEQIVQDIAHQRNLSLSAIEQWAESNNFTAQQGLALNLVDELGSMHQATQTIRKMALIEDEIAWTNPPTQKTLMSLISGASTDDDSFLTCCAKVLKFMPLV